MKNLSLILIIIAGISFGLRSQPTYFEVYGQAESAVNSANSIVKLSDNAYVLGGEWNGVGVLMKVDHRGKLLNRLLIDNHVPGTSKVTDMSLTSNGNIIAVGECKNCLVGDTLLKVFALQVNSNLSVISKKFFKSSTAINSLLYRPFIHRKGNQLMLATTAGGPGWNFEDVKIYKLTENLDTLWSKTYNGCGNCGFEFIVDITGTNNGYAFVALNAFTDSITLWHVNDDGDLIWKKRYPWLQGHSYSKITFNSTIYVAGSEQITTPYSTSRGGVLWSFSPTDGNLISKIVINIDGVHDELSAVSIHPPHILVAHNRQVPTGYGGFVNRSRIYHLNSLGQIMKYTDIANSGGLTNTYANEVLILSSDGNEFAVTGWQNAPQNSFYFAKNSYQSNSLFSAAPDTCCAPVAIHLANNYFVDADSHKWYHNGQLFSEVKEPGYFPINTAGVHTFKMEAHKSSGTRIDHVVVNSLPRIWNDGGIFDFVPDPYLRIKNSLGQIVYTSAIVSAYPPVTLPVSYILDLNDTYNFEVFDYDALNNDDYFGSFIIPGTTQGGMFTYQHPGDTVVPLKITIVASPFSGATYSEEQVVVVYKPLVKLETWGLRALPGDPAPSQYSFQWLLNGNNLPGATSNTFVPQVSGFYSVIMTTPYCTVQSDPVWYQKQLLVQSEIKSPSCFGFNDGSILITPIDGVSPYTYTWNPSSLSGNNPTNLPAGDYSVTVSDAQGIKVTLQFQLTQPDEIILSANWIDPTCKGANNGSILLSISDTVGIDPDKIVWCPMGTGILPTQLSEGVYSTTVTNSRGCTASIFVELKAGPGIQISSTLWHVSCHGGTDGGIDLTVSGGVEPITCTWNDPSINTCNPSDLAAGEYHAVVVDANGCSAEFSGDITEPLPITIDIVTTPFIFSGSNEIAGTATATVQGGTPPYHYRWLTQPPQTSPTAVGLKPGIYSLIVTDANGCSQVAIAGIESISASSDQKLVSDIRVFPNPANTLVTVEGNQSGQVQVLVFNAIGRMIRKVENSGLPVQLNVEDWADGIYWLHLRNAHGLSTIKLSVVH